MLIDVSVIKLNSNNYKTTICLIFQRSNGTGKGLNHHGRNLPQIMVINELEGVGGEYEIRNLKV